MGSFAFFSSSTFYFHKQIETFVLVFLSPGRMEVEEDELNDKIAVSNFIHFIYPYDDYSTYMCYITIIDEL